MHLQQSPFLCYFQLQMPTEIHVLVALSGIVEVVFFSFLADKFCKANNNILPLDQLIANKYLNSHVVTPACIYLQNKQVFYVKTI